MKNYFKKIGLLLSGLTILFIFGSINSYTFGKGASSTPYGLISQENSDPEVDGQIISDNNPVGEGSNRYSNFIQNIMIPDNPSSYDTRVEYVCDLIRISINWFLAILATVALAYLLYCGFLIFTSGGDEAKTKKGKKGISTAAIAIAGILLAWSIVSFMFRFIETIIKTN